MLSQASTRARPATGHRSLAFGVALAILLVGVWVALTAVTGKTYHLAPVLAAAAPAWGARLSGVVVAPPDRLLALAAGVLVVAAGWAAIVLAGIEPTTTVIHDQPGGVPAEVAVGALAGAALSALVLLRSQAR